MMKVLYVVNAYDGKYVDFHAVQVIGENENEFEILDRMNVENYVHNSKCFLIKKYFNLNTN